MAWTDKDFATGAKLTAAEMDELIANYIAVGRSKIAGLVISNDADADHDILIAVGIAIDNTNGAVLELTTAITKRIDAVWAAGDDGGGLFSGTVGNTTWYHVHLIKKDSDNSIDAGFDTSVSAANIPAGYTAFRRLGAVLTDGSANIRGFSAREIEGGGLEVLWKVPSIDQGFSWSGGADDTAITITLAKVPNGIQTRAILSSTFLDTTPAAFSVLLITSLDETDVAPDDPTGSYFGTMLLSAIASAASVIQNLRISTARGFRIRAKGSTTSHRYFTTVHGWIDERR